MFVMMITAVLVLIKRTYISAAVSSSLVSFLFALLPLRWASPVYISRFQLNPI